MNLDDFSQACKVAISKSKRLKIEQVTIANNESFATFGLDSLDTMNFLLELEQSLNISLGEFDLAEYNTIEKLYTLIN